MAQPAACPGLCCPLRGGDRTTRVKLAQPRKARWDVCVRGLLLAVVRIQSQVRERDRVAELLSADSWSYRDKNRLQTHPSANRISLRSLWRPSRTCVR